MSAGPVEQAAHIVLCIASWPCHRTAAGLPCGGRFLAMDQHTAECDTCESWQGIESLQAGDYPTCPADGEE